MSKKRKDVVFRRIRGRIVPIRISKQQQEGIGLLGASAAVGGLTAAISSVFGSRGLRQARKTSIFTRRGLGQLNRGNQSGRFAARKSLNIGRKSFATQTKLFKISEGVIKPGSFFAGGLAGVGVSRLFKTESDLARTTADVAGFTVGSSVQKLAVKLIKKKIKISGF